MDCNFRGASLIPHIRFFVSKVEGYFEFCSRECKDKFNYHIHQAAIVKE